MSRCTFTRRCSRPSSLVTWHLTLSHTPTQSCQVGQRGGGGHWPDGISRGGPQAHISVMLIGHSRERCLLDATATLSVRANLAKTRVSTGGTAMCGMRPQSQFIHNGRMRLVCRDSLLIAAYLDTLHLCWIVAPSFRSCITASLSGWVGYHTTPPPPVRPKAHAYALSFCACAGWFL
jgi:hypothetical protein